MFHIILPIATLSVLILASIFSWWKIKKISNQYQQLNQLLENQSQQQIRHDEKLLSLQNSLTKFQETYANGQNIITNHFTQQFNESNLKQSTTFNSFQEKLMQQLNSATEKNQSLLTDIQASIKHQLVEHRAQLDQHLLNNSKNFIETLQKSMADIRQQVINTLNNNNDHISKCVDKLTQDTDQRLKEISGQVDKRLTEGFEKTTATFTDVIKRLAMIDEAQKKITELSSNVVDLQDVLTDKRSRGAFGEVQLSSLIRNILPTVNFSFQHTLSNTKRVDCMLFLPEPTGNIAIDSKFPLETFRKINQADESNKKQLEQQFRNDIKKHIQDIANKYIIPGETSDGAVMFIPAEAIFADIHSNYPEIIEYAYKSRVWLTSPTTMMAILTTARAVLKDAATRQQVHIIQEHLSFLGKDFDRFQKRMDNLSRHINQAQQDVEQVHTSAKKISTRFNKIEQVDFVGSNSNAVSDLLIDTAPD